VGGNCPLTEADRTVIRHGVTLIGETNLPARLATDASALYSRNVFDFLKLLFDTKGGLLINLEDDIVSACLVTRDNLVVRK
jgi:H+-translocating NAD(P) transhydrogenase subunit alpha